jgi:hypothetical protein
MRLLNDLEKEICNRLVHWSDSKHLFITKIIEYKLEGIGIAWTKDPKTVKIYFNLPPVKDITQRIPEVISFLFTVVVLIKNLEKEGYIYMFQSLLISDTFTPNSENVYVGNKKASGSFGLGHCKGNRLPENIVYEFPDDEISNLLIDYSNKEIILTEEFKRFCNRGFIARDEQRFRRQTLIATTALVIAVVSSTANLKNIFSNGTRIKQDQIDTLATRLRAIENKIEVTQGVSTNKIDSSKGSLLIRQAKIEDSASR